MKKCILIFSIFFVNQIFASINGNINTSGGNSIFGKGGNGGNVIDKSTNNASGSSNINKSNDINTDIGVKLHK